MRSRDLELTEPMLLNGSPWGRHRVDSGGFQTNFFQAEMKELRARMPFLTEADAFLEHGMRFDHLSLTHWEGNV